MGEERGTECRVHCDTTAYFFSLLFFSLSFSSSLFSLSFLPLPLSPLSLSLSPFTPFLLSFPLPSTPFLVLLPLSLFSSSLLFS